MPRVVRPDPPLPMSVAIASRVFSSELLVGLIRYFQYNPGSSNADVARQFGISHTLVHTNVTILLQAAVLTVEIPPEDRRARLYYVDALRVRQLVDALRSYTLGPPGERAPDRRHSEGN